MEKRGDGVIQIEGIAEQNGLTEIFEHDPFNFHFYQHIQQMTGQRREGKPRGRPRKSSEGEGITGEQGELEL